MTIGSNTSVNRTAESGLSRYRKQSLAAAGYLKRWATWATPEEFV